MIGTTKCKTFHYNTIMNILPIHDDRALRYRDVTRTIVRPKISDCLFKKYSGHHLNDSWKLIITGSIYG